MTYGIGQTPRSVDHSARDRLTVLEARVEKLEAAITSSGVDVDPAKRYAAIAASED